ncbi:MAG: ArsA family ATPase [Bacillota bacterium]
MRVIVYTGKGGVGKTSVAAATATRLAKLGYKTLIMSTDAAHSLADSLDQPLGPDPVPVAGNLWGQEIDSLREAERNWGDIQRWLAGLMAWAKVESISTEELLVFPGMEELFSLLQIRKHVLSGRYDALIVDCAPTGETLRMLNYPSALRWWIEKIFPMKKKVVKVARPIARMAMHGLELPSDQVMDSMERLMYELADMHRILLDHGTTSMRLVVNPEKMVIAEARRSFTYLNLFGFNTDAVVINRVLPPEAEESYLARWREVQAKHNEEIEASFNPLPIFRIPLMETEVVGLPMLERVAEAAFGERDPAGILYTGQVEELRPEGGGYLFELAVPFVPKEQINLTQRGDELTVSVGWYKRKVVLPRMLTGRPILGARFTEDRLAIRFGERSVTETAMAEEEAEA